MAFIFTIHTHTFAKVGQQFKRPSSAKKRIDPNTEKQLNNYLLFGKRLNFNLYHLRPKHLILHRFEQCVRMWEPQQPFSPMPFILNDYYYCHWCKHFWKSTQSHAFIQKRKVLSTLFAIIQIIIILYNLWRIFCYYYFFFWFFIIMFVGLNAHAVSVFAKSIR